MKESKNFGPRCPIRTTMEMLGGKWRLLIINAIGKESKRYGELRKDIPEISEKMLTQELKSLVDNDLVIRKNYGEVPPRVDYSLTEKGFKAYDLMKPISEFGIYYMNNMD